MIWILLPAYNEEKALTKLIPKIASFALDQKFEYQVVVVNDGSTDSTELVLKSFSDKAPLHIVTHTINRGLGETERDGFEYIAARAKPEDIVVRLDADDTHEPEYILRLTNKINEGFDVVSSSRFQEGGAQIGVNGYRAFISLCANLFMKFVFNVKGIRDYSCGYRAYRAQVIQDAVSIFGNNFIQLKGLGFTSTLEMLVKFKILGCRFAEVPFVLRYDQKPSESKMVSSLTTIGYLLMGLLYHWPFGGWKRQYKNLTKLYPADRSKALVYFRRGKVFINPQLQKN